ncbi:MAG: glycogen synthase GlgA [Planctomycetota bacterium]
MTLVASEAVPFAKTGGLGDVVGAIPRALSRLGVNVTVVLPAYPPCFQQPHEDTGKSITILMGDKPRKARLLRATFPGGLGELVLIDQPDLYQRSGIYGDPSGADYPDNCERFAFLCRAAFEALDVLDLPVDCLHAHDWQGGLVPAYLRHLYGDHPRFRHAGSLFTIHNAVFQGIFPKGQWRHLGLGESLFSRGNLDYHDQICFLKGGILESAIVTAVSERYAKEIQGPEFGCGMDPFLRDRAHARRLVGIVNGIDVEHWDPAMDAALPSVFDRKRWRKGKSECKRALLRELGLPEVPGRPLLGMVGRLTEQKGLDLFVGGAESLMHLNAQYVVLGTGEERYRSFFSRLMAEYPERVAARFAFDEGLAHRIYAGSDMFLMPSRFEPCGLSQLYGLRYGSVPVVHAVGGLVDTVCPVTPRNLANHKATGFSFQQFTAEAFVRCLRRATQAFADKKLWSSLVERGMREDWSWENSARHYLETYKSAKEHRLLELGARSS